MCVTLACMITRTIIYRDTDFLLLDQAIDYMSEQARWAVRAVEVLEPVHEVKRNASGPDSVRVLVKVLTVLVVYERERE